MREMFILMGEMVKSEVVKKAQQASYMVLLIDEVMDIAQREQLVSFIRYVDPDTNEVKTDFLALSDILESSSSANAETITSVVVKQLSDCDLDINKLSGLSTDGASVMIVKENCVAAKLKREAKMLLNVHCIFHRLALACGDANDDISYIKTVEKVDTTMVFLPQLGKTHSSVHQSSDRFSRSTDFKFCKEEGCEVC